MMKRHLVGTLAVILATAGAARAQETPAAAPVPASTPAAAPTGGGAADAAGMFGLLGQIVISGEMQLSFVHASGGGGSANQIVVQPALDYFVAPNISVGGVLTLAHTSLSGGGSSTNIGIGVRGGYNLHLAEMLSLWPQLQLAYEHGSSDPGGVSSYNVNLQIFAPFLYHVTQHVFVGLGPTFRTELISKVMSASVSKETDFGVSSVVGGYFGGT